ncbi:MAG: STAS/SEC14 domain-containing protein [Desulfuromonadaceae bacterium]|nr:STAS/SEC14 domain-containing protein [Desulfuromonadaceae bacterium]
MQQNDRRFLYLLGKKFTGLDTHAMRDDAKTGLEHFNAWERVAVVTDVGWIRRGGGIWIYNPRTFQVFLQLRAGRIREMIGLLGTCHQINMRLVYGN